METRQIKPATPCYDLAQVFAQALQLNAQTITLRGRLNLAVECQEIRALATPELAVPGPFQAAIWLTLRGGKNLDWNLSGRLVQVQGKLLVAERNTWPGLGHMGGYYLELVIAKRCHILMLD